MVYMTRIAVLLLADLVAVSGCATKDWVRDLMGKKEVEIGSRVDGLGNQLRSTETNLGNQIRTTDANLGETSQIARGASERADAAM